MPKETNPRRIEVVQPLCNDGNIKQLLRTHVIKAFTAILLLLVLQAGVALAQSQEYTLALREVPLDEALERFVEATGMAVSYEPSLVRGRRASCAAEHVDAENVLRCILSESGLDFYRLSSGTYVVTERVRLAPERGFVTGRVFDVETGGPLAASHVQLADAGLTTVTDRSGRFTFPALLPGRYVLTITHIGYRAWRDTLSIGPREQLLAEAALRSEPIFITPIIVDGLQRHRPSSVMGRPSAVSSGAPTGLASAPGPVRRVQTLPGVRLNDVTADVHVQGGDAGAQQFRLDGVPVFLPRSIAGLVGPFSSFAFDQITVHKAGFGAAHGSQMGGIVLAEHALADANDFDVQGDPYTLNARMRLSPGGDGHGKVAAMVAARVGLWDMLAPSRLQSTLEGWSRPDPFLLMAPLEDMGASLGASGTSNLLGAPVNPAVRFSDLHGAARVRFGPLRSLHASFYQGRHNLGGGVFSGDRGARFQSDAASFTVIDDYSWRNELGQIRYEAVLGSRTLAGLQLRAGRYRLDHDYRTLDSLDIVLQNNTTRLAWLSTTPVRDGNSVATLALEGSIDHAYGPHHLKLGAEGGIVDSRFDLRSVHFATEERITDGGTGTTTEADRAAFGQPAVSSTVDSWYAASYLEDRIRLMEHFQAEAGVRLTYLNARQTVYAEPRGALLYDRPGSMVGPWSARTSAGIYRQFLNQTDASKLNAGALLPSVRVWLPVDATVRPPMAYHLAQELLFTSHKRWTLRVEGYVKIEQHGLALAYAPADQARFLHGKAAQSEFLTGTRGSARGGTASVSFETSHFRAEGRYAYERATRRSDALFGGRRHPVPWSEPHRLELAADWMPKNQLAFTARWHGVWSRTWGFRQAYYDYFGHTESTRFHARFDLGDPASHRLPAIRQLDISVAYSQPLGPAVLQLRGEVINVYDRANVIDWRLVRDGETWRKEARLLYPMMPALAVRLSL